MEEIKIKKKLNKKPLIICLVLALVFGIVGFVDIKSNAAESYTVNVSYDRTTGNEILDKTVRTFRSSSPMQVYIYCSHYEPAILTEKIWGYAYVVSDSSIDSVAGQNCVQFEKNGRVFYVLTLNMSAGPYGESSGQKNQYYEVYSDSGNDIFVNTQYATSYDFAQAYINDSLDLVVDYNTFEIDEDIPLIKNPLRNEVVNNEKDSTLEIIVPNTYRYDYITWTNTSELELQVEVAPVLQYYKGVLEKDYVKEYQGSWLKSDVLEKNTNNYLWLTKITSVEENYPQFTEWFYSTRDKYYPDWNEILNFTYAYRIRYVDKDSQTAGLWVYIVPDKKFETFKTYVEYLDDSHSNSTSADGSQEVYENLEDINDALVDVDKENQFKEEYQITTGGVDTTQATNWLYSVVDFIKTTPSMVGTVLAFLPQPILYGMYVTIFLGCIASAIAIVKALI